MCRYGYNGVCASLPLDGVSDRDYESHVNKYHVTKPDKGTEPWSVNSSAQNLPAVLNDPGRGKQANLFTKKWGDAFVEKVHITPSVYLPDITYDHFETYMKRIGRRFKRHQRISQNGQQQQMSTTPQSPSSHKAFNELHEASLSDIPSIFTKPTLELNSPSTFAQVFPGIGDEDNERQSGRLLQEKLSHYLDIVEVQIAKQV